MITENFIKQCEKAEEIQKKWRVPFKSYVGDLYWKGTKYLMIPEACLFVTEIMFEPKDDFIYLPTQEQLWEKVWLILEKYPAIAYVFKIERHETIISFNVGKYIDEGYKKIYSSNTIQECLLQFIYNEKYNKIWTGKDWIKED